MAKIDTPVLAEEPVWLERAVSRSLSAARSRAEQRVQRFMAAAFELIDERGSTDFTIQEVVDRSRHSLRSFYQYFDGKDELLFALFEENVREAVADLRATADAESEPLASLRALAMRLHRWCDPVESGRELGTHNRLPLSEFSVQLAFKDPERVQAVMAPIGRLLRDRVEAAARAGAIEVDDVRRAAVLLQQTVMHSWILSRLVPDRRMRVTSEQTWQFCLRGLGVPADRNAPGG